MSLHDLMTVSVPEGELNGMKVERFEVKAHDLNNLREALRSGRGTRPGIYTRLTENGSVWMSDVDAEKRDHLTPLAHIRNLKAKRVLLNGLGLGMVLKAALSFDHLEHIDVVERDERVIKLVGPHYLRDPRVRIHHADAYEQTKAWPKGTRWDVGWSDIWQDISTDDLPQMARMNRSYGRRCTWHGCWGQDQLNEIARQERKHASFWS
ncbi:MAG: hypothetical protein IJI97_01520 [Clostridia bacterium]|nr:hypothetical protein [Clostridia bacterium]